MIVALLFILGLCVGSFLNVLADRLPKGEDVIRGRSHCDFCKHKLLWYELIPLFSFIFQGGKSKCCHKKLSWQYPVSELATGVGFIWIYQSCYELLLPAGQAGVSSFEFIPIIPLIFFLSCLVLFSCLLVIFISDLKYEIIPIEMIIVGFISACIYHFLRFTNFTNFINFPLSSLGAGLFFFSLWFLTKGKAMGDGDIYLAALIGFLLGFPNIIISLYAAFLTGALVGIILVLGQKKSLKAHIPFGPFLILGYGITLLWGETILRIWRLLW